MKTSTKAILITVSGLAVATVIVFAGIVYYNLFCNIQSIQPGDYIASHPSPNGNYQINIYLSNGGATTDFAILGELENTETGEKKNIYWDYHISEAEVIWSDNNVVFINGRKLNIDHDIYDFRLT